MYHIVYTTYVDVPVHFILWNIIRVTQNNQLDTTRVSQNKPRDTTHKTQKNPPDTTPYLGHNSFVTKIL
jgi:hypothetical protein